jgi:hypothetical protein
MGSELTYGYLVSCHFELGFGSTYRAAFGPAYGLYAHVLELPAHVGAVVPAGQRADFAAAAYFGFTHFWLRNQESSLIAGADTVRAAGFHIGPRFLLAVHLTSTLDLLGHTGLILRFVKVTNGRSYLDDLIIFGQVVPIGLGLRLRL